MKRRIFKYSFYHFRETVIEIPKDAEILSIQNQSGVVTMWVLVDIDAVKIERKFDLFTTGSDVPSSSIFRGTVQLNQGSFVVHVFEII